MARVVITGFAAFTPIGNHWEAIEANLKAGVNGIDHISEWQKYDGLNTALGAAVKEFELPEHYIRKRTRSMGRVSKMSTRAAELALEQAGLIDEPCLTDGSTGVAFGSSSGTPQAIAEFGRMLIDETTQGLNSTSYIRMMSHTALVNISVFFNLKGRAYTTSSACTSGSQAIGFAYEAVKSGDQTIMIAGGSDELSASQAAVFDTLYATSTQNDQPKLTPRPFDQDRDGLVIGEGAAALIVENRDHALARGAKPLAEIVGFSTNTDGAHITQPSKQTMSIVMSNAIKVADIDQQEIGYVSAHGTATDQGDVAESQATADIFGSNILISTLKSYTGHTLGACGAMEAGIGIQMMNNNWFHPTINLENIDPNCAELDYITGAGKQAEVEYFMSNNFAFGGINTSLIFKRA